jgi:tRNA threonylcarbamoyladenosine biosynthesis protein TsaB
VPEIAEPRLLIIETSTRIGQVAVAEGPILRAARRLDELRRHARDLAPAVAELLASQGWRPRDLNGVIVSRGPGSYTGLRVGLMSAKALAYATGCALLAVDTFAAVALQAPAAERLDVIADAQQERVYVQPFARGLGAEAWAPAGPLAIEPLAEWLARRSPAAHVTGPGLHVYRQRLPESVPVVEAERWGPEPDSLLRIGLARWRAGERDDVWTLEPLYLRPSAAEQQWKGR